MFSLVYFCMCCFSFTESMGVPRLTGGQPEPTKKAGEKGKAVCRMNS